MPATDLVVAMEACVFSLDELCVHLRAKPQIQAVIHMDYEELRSMGKQHVHRSHF